MKIKIPKGIIILTVFALLMNIFRVIIFHKMSFVYIPWNIFLAFIPFILSSFMFIIYKNNKKNYLLFIIGLFWLLFIPNAPYILTDFVHLGVVRGVPLLYDILLLFSSALIGLLLFFESFNHMKQILKEKLPRPAFYISTVLIFLLTSFGVYLGRFLRFNSWDIFINHYDLVKGVSFALSRPNGVLNILLYTVLISAFLFLAYFSWELSKKEPTK